MVVIAFVERASLGSEPASRPQRPWRGASVFIGSLLFAIGISLLSPVMRAAVGLGAGIAGIGVEFDEEAAAKFTFDPKYLPINRRLDGSVHDW